MALQQLSSFIYGYTVTTSNRNLDFRIVALGAVKTAVLRTGTYGLQELCDEIERAMAEQDATNTYTVSVNYNVSSGTQNRVTIATSGAYLDLLFSSGPNAATSCRTLIGFAATDQTGSTSYTGTSTTGTYLFPTQIGYTYQPTDTYKRVQGVVNVSANGTKETVVFSTQEFFQVEFKYEPQASAFTTWEAFLSWAATGAEVEFTPDITAPTTVVRCTLEKTDLDGKGLGFLMKEMLPDFPFFYRTGILHFRKVPT